MTIGNIDNDRYNKVIDYVNQNSNLIRFAHKLAVYYFVFDFISWQSKKKKCAKSDSDEQMNASSSLKVPKRIKHILFYFPFFMAHPSLTHKHTINT